MNKGEIIYAIYKGDKFIDLVRMVRDELPDTDIQIDFDDSIIEDKQTERACDRQDVAIGAMQLWEYRAKWYAEPKETAKAMVQMDDRDVIE